MSFLKNFWEVAVVKRIELALISQLFLIIPALKINCPENVFFCQTFFFCQKNVFLFWGKNLHFTPEKKVFLPQKYFLAKKNIFLPINLKIRNIQKQLRYQG